MGTLHIHDMDDGTIIRYHSAGTDEKRDIRRVIAFWIDGNSEAIGELLEKRRQAEMDKIRRDALAYADDHPVFPLNWSRSKLTREEMNER